MVSWSPAQLVRLVNVNLQATWFSATFKSFSSKKKNLITQYQLNIIIHVDMLKYSSEWGKLMAKVTLRMVCTVVPHNLLSIYTGIFIRVQPSLELTRNFSKQRKCEWQLCSGKCLVDVRGQGSERADWSETVKKVEVEYPLVTNSVFRKVCLYAKHVQDWISACTCTWTRYFEMGTNQIGWLK